MIRMRPREGSLMPHIGVTVVRFGTGSFWSLRDWRRRLAPRCVMAQGLSPGLERECAVSVAIPTWAPSISHPNSLLKIMGLRPRICRLTRSRNVCPW
jgi:hypothetical protein